MAQWSQRQSEAAARIFARALPGPQKPIIPQSCTPPPKLEPISWCSLPAPNSSSSWFSLVNCAVQTNEDNEIEEIIVKDNSTPAEVWQQFDNNS